MDQKSLRIFLLAVLTLAGLTALPCRAQTTLVLNSSFSTPITSPDQTGALDLFYQELGRRAGVRFVIQNLPAERGLLNANKGIDDGDVSRVLGLDQQYTNLLRVPEQVMYYQMVVFTRKADFVVAGAESLKPYDVGILTGWKILEKNIVNTRSLVKLETAEQLFTMLDKGRIDVAVIEKLEGLYFVKMLGLKNMKILQPAFVEGDWFLYLNKKHAALVPKLAEAIRQMKQDGTHEKIFSGVLGRYAQ